MYHLGLDRILLSLLYDLQYTDLCVYLIRDPYIRFLWQYPIFTLITTG